MLYLRKNRGAMAKIAKKLNPCPIIEATLELRFQTQLPPDAVVGVLYNIFQEESAPVALFPLPISQIPVEIRLNDPNLRYKPTHKLQVSGFDALVGSNVLMLSISGEYKGWDNFKEHIAMFIEKIKQTSIMSTITYLGLRYLNFFNNDIFEKINMLIGSSDFPRGNPSVFKTEYKKEGHVEVLQITSGIHLKNATIDADGSLIDITSVLAQNHLQGVNLANINDKIDSAHTAVEQLFYALLSEEYIQSLNPGYE